MESPPLGLPQSVKNAPLRCRAYLSGTGILTGFPFVLLQLASHLGSPYPWLTNIAKETMCFRRPGFSPGYAATNTRIIITGRSARAYARVSAQPVRLLTRLRALCNAPLRGIGTWLTAPIIFRIRTLGWSAITRCLKDGCF